MPHPRDDLLAEIATLRDRNEELEAEVDFLREQLVAPDAEYEAARLLGIPHWAVPALHLFVVRKVVPTGALMAVSDDKEWGPDSKYPHIAVYHLRRRLNPKGVHIETIWGIGYRTTPDNHARLRALVR